jgi:hypothetical protein
MFMYGILSKPTRPEEGGADWVDFPASPEPDPWAALLREANRLPPDVSGTERSARQEATHQMLLPPAAMLVAGPSPKP